MPDAHPIPAGLEAVGHESALLRRYLLARGRAEAVQWNAKRGWEDLLATYVATFVGVGLVVAFMMGLLVSAAHGPAAAVVGMGLIFGMLASFVTSVVHPLRPLFPYVPIPIVPDDLERGYWYALADASRSCAKLKAAGAAEAAGLGEQIVASARQMTRLADRSLSVDSAEVRTRLARVEERLEAARQAAEAEADPIVHRDLEGQVHELVANAEGLRRILIEAERTLQARMRGMEEMTNLKTQIDLCALTATWTDAASAKVASQDVRRLIEDMRARYAVVESELLQNDSASEPYLQHETA